MKRFICLRIYSRILFITFCICLLITNFSCSKNQENKLRHVVLFGFNPEVTKTQLTEIETAFKNLPKQIKEVKGYEWGTDCSPEGLQKGHTHCFFLTFDNESDRDAYLIHPAHKEFGKLINGKLSNVTVIDYWVK